MRDPINPADIRVGDRVERVIEARGVETTFRCVITRLEGGLIHAGWLGWSVLDGGQWFLLDRPDPLAEVVEVVTKALLIPLPGAGLKLSREVANQIVAAISERWELVERGKP